MGGCCFTPKKTQLLWWYWLLLFSIVGIPMFAAALYVRSAARHGLLEAWQVRAASRIFWLGACGSFLLAGFLLPFLITRVPYAVERYSNPMWFAASLLFWLAVAVGAAKLTEKAHPWYARAAVVTCCAVIPAAGTWFPYALLSSSQDALGLMPMGVMKFLVCMLPAHYWHRFTVSPGTRRAWVFLGTLAVGTALFWVVSQYGHDTHVFLFSRLWGVSPGRF
jgi:hypothetical protein